MTSANSSVRALRWALVGIGLMLPVLSLVPLGSLWLWQNGYLIPWAIAACTSTVIAWATQRWLLGTVATGEASGVSGSATTTPGDTTWTPAETAAWAKVQEIAALVVPDTLGSQEALLELGQRTLETVARSLHPDHKDPLLKFTAPEALALIERVAGRLDTFVRESVPLGDRLTLAQLMTLYRWRGSIEIAEQAWGVWRALRVLNPASALANEVRERVSKELVTWGKTHIARKLATVYVEEVGRAAIDLYGGRLRFAPDRAGSRGHATGRPGCLRCRRARPRRGSAPA